MKRWIHATTDTVVTAYHGGKIPTHGSIQDSIMLPDLGLHVGSIEQARSHSKTSIYEVQFILKNVTTVPDQGNWNDIRSVYEILKSAGVNMSIADITRMLRDEVDKYGNNWQTKSDFFCNLLVDNGVSVIKYQNAEDPIKDECYCIVDPDVIKSVKEVEFDMAKK